MVALTLFSTGLWSVLLFIFYHHSWMEIAMELVQSLLLYFCIYEILHIVTKWGNQNGASQVKIVLISLAVLAIVYYPVFKLMVHSQLWILQITGIESIVTLENRFLFSHLIWLVQIVYGYLTAYFLRFLLQSREQQLELVSQRAENLQKEATLLKKQLSPHFLFNSLNTLEGLMKNENVRGKKFLTELSNVYHYLLRNANVVTLQEELDFTRSYLYMTEVRYGKAFQVQISIPEDWMETHIPAVSIQLLVENAIKHNTFSEEKPLTIEISTDMRPDSLYVIVSNNVNLKPYQQASRNSGTGLSNLNERYRLMDLPEIIIRKNDLRFSVEIPVFV